MQKLRLKLPFGFLWWWHRWTSFLIEVKSVSYAMYSCKHLHKSGYAWEMYSVCMIMLYTSYVTHMSMFPRIGKCVSCEGGVAVRELYQKWVQPCDCTRPIKRTRWQNTITREWWRCYLSHISRHAVPLLFIQFVNNRMRDSVHRGISAVDWLALSTTEFMILHNLGFIPLINFVNNRIYDFVQRSISAVHIVVNVYDYMQCSISTVG